MKTEKRSRCLERQAARVHFTISVSKKRLHGVVEGRQTVRPYLWFKHINHCIRVVVVVVVVVMVSPFLSVGTRNPFKRMLE